MPSALLWGISVANARTSFTGSGVRRYRGPCEERWYESLMGGDRRTLRAGSARALPA